MNNCVYVFIKKADVTTAMLNRSINNKIESAPTFISQSGWWIFQMNTEYVVLEVPSENLLRTNVFDNYTWYTCSEARQKITEFNAQN